MSQHHDEEDLSVDSSDFYPEAFALAVRKRKAASLLDGDNLKHVCTEEYEALSRRLEASKIQEACAVRNVLRTRRLANLLINDDGELNLSALSKVIVYLKHHLYSLGPNRQYDGKRQEHLLRVLILLHEKKEFYRLIKSIDKLHSQGRADQLIRDTLQIPPSVPLTDAHFRRAILSAWMCTLRQNVGSCFATAPGIIIHDEQPEMFLKDIVDLLISGKLKRTFGGVEYSVPLSISWGGGDLKKAFSLPLGDNFDKSAILLSPGLEAAFQSVALIDPEAALDDRILRVKELIRRSVVHTQEAKASSVVITAEQIIRLVLLEELGLKESDLIQYENRPTVPMQRSLFVLASTETKGRSKGQLCETFFAQFKTACNAFKGLADNALLKSWEFSIASFSETKAQFTRWNLYASLGVGHDEPGGIGICIYKLAKRRLDEANQKIVDSQNEYEQVYLQLKGVESRMQNAATEKEAQWLRAEYQTKRQHFYALEEMRNEMSHKAERLANFYSLLINHYDDLFPNYFQEVYDADMHDVAAGPYNDSPAGFRLLYKHGRSNTSQWSYIHTPAEFIEALVSFFISTENEISASKEFEGLQKILSEAVTEIVTLVRTKEFLETAFYRMASAHKTPAIKNPLEHLDKIEKKPWAYTSGGTVNTLLCCYYKLDDKPKEVSRWVESPFELCVFLIDTLKQLPPFIIKSYVESPFKMMLMHSPTHVFLLSPSAKLFKEGWQSDIYTYTWLRDTIVNPRKEFIESLWLDKEMMDYLIGRLAEHVPEDFRHYFSKFDSLYGNMRPKEFRNHILGEIKRYKGLQQSGSMMLSADQIDSVFYSLLPLFSRISLKERLQNIYQAIPSLSIEQRHVLSKTFDKISPSLTLSATLDADSLQNICKGLICLAFEETTSEVDYHIAVSTAAQQLGYAMPAPFIVADTNWITEEFGFVVNPGTEEYELWRIDITGRIGFPMSSWKEWLNGTRREPPWGIYTNL